MTLQQAGQRLTGLLGIEHPIVQGGMTWVSGHALAAAVSNAGGLGVIGAGAMDPMELQAEVRALRELTSRPFGVNLPLVNVRPDAVDHTARMIEVLMDEQVPVAFIGAGSPNKFTALLQSRGVQVVHVVPSVELALKAQAAGVDAVVAEGSDAGGHVQSEGLSTLALIPQVVDALHIPVIAAGGIADGRGLLAALSLGADGVQMGTRFIATTECNAHPSFKQAVLQAGTEGSALYSRKHHTSRALATPIVQQLRQMEDAGCTQAELLAVRGLGRAKKGCVDGNLDEGILPAGTACGLVRELVSAGQVIEEVVSQAEAILERWNGTAAKNQHGKAA